VRAIRTSLLVVTAALFATPALSEGRVTGFVAATTDYVYRGASQTYGDPALQADIHYETAAGSFVGIWGSTSQPGAEGHTTVEFNAYAGRSWLITTDWRIKLTGVHYFYLDGSRYGVSDLNEVVGSLAYRDRLFATVAWSPDTARYANGYATPRHSATSYELASHLPLRNDWYLAGGAGYYDLTAFWPTGYWFWNAGIGVDVRHYGIDLSYFGADSTARRHLGSGRAGSNWALTLAWRF
jgi:uncharacterized protein (TIGR02001 family)